MSAHILCLGRITYLKDDVADIKNAQDCVVIVASETKISLQTCDTGIANIRTVDEAEEIEQGHRWNDHQIDLEA